MAPGTRRRLEDLEARTRSPTRAPFAPGWSREEVAEKVLDEIDFAAATGWRERVRRIEGEHRVFAQEAMRRDRGLLEENRAAVGLGPLGAEWEKDQARVYGLEGGEA